MMVHHLPPIHLFRTSYSNGKYFGVCIGCKWRGKPKSKYDDAVYAGRLHCKTANLVKQETDGVPPEKIKCEVRR